LTSTERYIPTERRWEKVGDLHRPRRSHALVVCNDLLYCLGGWDGRNYSNSVERFDPSTGVWTEGIPMLDKRNLLSAVCINNEIYAIGGWNGSQMLKTVERFDGKMWSYVSDMVRPRSGASATVLNGKIYVVGGFASGNETTAECFNPELNLWHICLETEKKFLEHSLITV